MEYRKLGKTDMSVSAVAMGCWALAGNGTWGPQDDDVSIATVHAALDAGVNFFDTAEGYGNGHSEEVLGRALAGRRQEAVIATKVSGGHLAPDALRKACEDSLQRLRTDYIDLYQIHWPGRQVPLADAVEGLKGLKEQGRIRAFGVCNFGVQDLSELLTLGGCETDQVLYNLLYRAIEYGIQQACVANDVGILCYSPMAQGLLTGKFATADDVPEGRARTRIFSADRAQAGHGEPGCEAEAFAVIDAFRRICEKIGEPMFRVALAWTLQRPGVTATLAGSRAPEQIRQNATACELTLSDDAIAELEAATEGLKQRLGANADMWNSESRMR